MNFIDYPELSGMFLKLIFIGFLVLIIPCEIGAIIYVVRLQGFLGEHYSGVTKSCQ